MILKEPIYIAGPMTGCEDHNYPAFFDAEEHLRVLGYSDIVNPARINPINLNGEQELTWEECMKRDIPELLRCNSIYVLIGWSCSRGAKLEMRLAGELEINPVAYEGFDIIDKKG
jgi:hypothetical protein